MNHLSQTIRCLKLKIRTDYRIAGNFGEVFNLANWRFYRKSPNLKSAIFYSDVI